MSIIVFTCHAVEIKTLVHGSVTDTGAFPFLFTSPWQIETIMSVFNMLMHDGISDMHCMSDAYLAEELANEYLSHKQVVE